MTTPKRRIRIALLAPFLPPGGAERQMMYLAAALPRPEFDVRFILLSERGPLADEAEALGLRVDVLGIDRHACSGVRPACVMALARAVRSYYRLTRGVDIVDAWLVPAYTFAGIVQPIARVPVLMAGRRSLLDVERTRRWYRELAGSLSMRFVDAVVANSQAAADQAVETEGIARERVHVIRNAVEPIAASDADVRSWRRRWGADDAEVVAGCVASLQAGKGHDLLLDVVDSLRDTLPTLRMVFIGDGPLRDPLQREIDRRGLGELVTLHTGVLDARGCYPALDIAVQASESEGLPNVVLEAAAAGRAIVATDVGGTREIITNDLDGLLVARGDRDGLAAALARVASDEDLRVRLGTAARERSRSFSIARLAAETGGLYARLLGHDTGMM